MFICTFHYTPEDVDCKLCTQYVRGQGCTEDSCPWIAERIEAGVVGYAEAVRDAFPKDPRLNVRLQNAVQSFSGSFFLDEAHWNRMERAKAKIGYRRKLLTPAFYAAVYLLTSNAEIFHRALNCFCLGSLQLDYATVRGISPHDYTLLSAAKDIYSDHSGVMLADLANRELIDPLAFSLIVNALLIARYGPAMLAIRERRALFEAAASSHHRS